MKEPQKNGKEQVAKAFARVASVYDKKWSFYLRATTEETLKRISITPGARVLDLGCGTGAMLVRLMALDGLSLFGIDPVPEMLEQAKAKLPEKVVLKVGWAEGIPFGAEEFDLVVSCNMFHYIRQPVAALREVNRVLRPGGKLVVTDWCGDFIVGRIRDLHARIFDPAHGKTYKERECMALLQEGGFTRVMSDRYKISCSWGLMTVQGNKRESLMQGH